MYPLMPSGGTDKCICMISGHEMNIHRQTIRNHMLTHNQEPVEEHAIARRMAISSMECMGLSISQTHRVISNRNLPYPMKRVKHHKKKVSPSYTTVRNDLTNIHDLNERVMLMHFRTGPYSVLEDAFFTESGSITAVMLQSHIGSFG